MENSNSTFNSGLNNSSIFSPNNMQSLNLNASSVLYPQQNSFNSYSQPYQLAQNTTPNSGSDVGDLVKANITFNDVYWGDGGRKNTHQIEGGYNNNRPNDRGGPTNFAVTQDTLDEYNNWNSYLRTGFNFPKDVKDLTHDQAKQILDERFYQAYNIKDIQNLIIARNVFDAEINQGPRAGMWLAESINNYLGTNYPRNKVISPALANKINSLSGEEAIKINDAYTQKRMKEYLNLVNRDHSQINNLKSWYGRARNHYSNQDEFDKLYKSTLDEYLNQKYPQYYNGK